MFKGIKKFAVITVIAAIVFVVSSGFSGCSSRVTLRVATIFGEGDNSNGVYSQICGLFEKENDVIIDDSSGYVANSGWVHSFIRDMQSPNKAYDVIFYFNGAQVDTFREKLVREDVIKVEYPDFAKDIVLKDDDPASIEMKAGTQAIVYNMDYFCEEDFNSLEDMLKKIKEIDKSGRKAVASSALLPHYFLNHILAYELGIEEYCAFNGKGDYFSDEKRQVWEDALKKSLDILKDIGFNSTEKYEDEEDAFMRGERGMIVTGQWSAVQIDSADCRDNIKFAAFPFEENAFIGGITNGWYITKNAWSDKKKRDLAVKFIEKNSTAEALGAYCTVSGGMPANGMKVEGDLVSHGFSSVKGRMMVAIDDRVKPAAKISLMGNFDISTGVPKLLSAESFTEKDVKSVLDDFIISL